MGRSRSIGFYTGKEGRSFAQFMAEAQSDLRLAEAFRERCLARVVPQ